MKPIHRCLNATLSNICQRVVQLEELNQYIHCYLPQEFHNHCRAGSFNKGCLVLVVSDSALASQLRFYLPELRDKLRGQAGLYQLISIKVNIAEEINTSLPQSKKTKVKPLSLPARKTILQGAEQCIYPPLRKALQHLAEPETKS